MADETPINTRPGDDRADTRCGFVALIGAPNAGKSTLLNMLVGAKVSIVTHKVQTTRALVRGIMVEDETQLVFIDTPGIFSPRRRLETAMVDAAWGGARDADVIVLVVDARSPDSEDVQRIVNQLSDTKVPVLLALNKVDLVKKDKLLGAAAMLNESHAFTETFMISALTGSGVADLRDALIARAPSGPWHYPEDQLTDLPLRMAASELTREKLMLRLHDELPYRLTVETEDWKDFGKKGVRIQQVIYVERDGHKGIVLGKGGQTIREIGQTAREEISAMLERPAHLFLFVKVRERWSEDPERYREMGLDAG
ncbi:MAG: GTPase Era [Pseudomonadota bacterium]